MTKPTTTPKTTTFAHLHEDGSFSSFCGSRLAVRLFGAPDDEIVEVRLVPDEEGAYWCWHDFKRNEYCMCMSSLSALKICFAGGIEDAEKRGRGVRVQVSVEDVEQGRIDSAVMTVETEGKLSNNYADFIKSVMEELRIRNAEALVESEASE